MIFVTVGTHEQPFNRLIQYIDEKKGKGIWKDDVIIQTGYSTYVPRYCEWRKMFPYQEMLNKVRDAKIIITHGGPSSFIMPLQIGKIPVVIPRKQQFGEHVNDHQIEFCRIVEERLNNIIMVEDIVHLENVILHYNEIAFSKSTVIQSKNLDFNRKLVDLIKELI